mmetsp:Transcript_25352/g.71138  ORF Transcript_25352/g.71138 Transcript_25352/m.71138 type:complete len:287 (-) Transcript_25352:92-952(-)
MQRFDRRVAEAVRRNGRRILLGDVDVPRRCSLRRIKCRAHAKYVLLAAAGRGGRGHGTGVSRDRGLLLAGRSDLPVYNNVDAPLLRLWLRGAVIDHGRGARVARGDGRETHLLLVARPASIVVVTAAGDAGGGVYCGRARTIDDFFGDQGAVHVYSGRDVVAARIADVDLKVLPRLDGNEAFGLARARRGPLDHVGLLPRPPPQPLPVPRRRVGVLHFHHLPPVYENVARGLGGLVGRHLEISLLSCSVASTRRMLIGSHRLADYLLSAARQAICFAAASPTADLW